MVYANKLSERGIRCGIKRRHTYVKVSGATAPDLSFEAHPFAQRGWWKTAIVGDVVKAPGAGFTARVRGGNGRQLVIVANGETLLTVPVTSDDFTYKFLQGGAGYWRLQLMNGSLVETVSSPIWVEPGSEAAALVDLNSTGEKISLGGLGGGMLLAGTLALAGWRRREKNDRQ